MSTDFDSKVPTLQQIMDEWEKDSPWRDYDIAGDIAKVDKLHSKYARYANLNHILSAKLDFYYKERREILRDWYGGDLNNDPVALAENGLKPNKSPISSKEAKDRKLDTDRSLNEILLKKAYCDAAIRQAEWVIKQLQYRGKNMGTALDAIKYYGSDGTDSFVPKKKD